MEGIRLASLINEYLKSLKIRNLAERSVSEKKWHLERFIKFLEENSTADIDNINRETVYLYQVHLYEVLNDKGMQNSITHQNNMLRTVKLFTKFLKEKSYIVSDPSQGIEYAKEPKRLPRGILTPTEARKIMHAPDTSSVIGYRDRTILEILYSSGIRKAELNNLKLNDVDYQDGFLRIIEGKGKKDRIVPIGRIACRYLENYIKSVRPELIKDPYNNYLFLSLKGNRISKNVIWEMIKKYAKKAKIRKNVSTHTFRHTCATAMLKNKADLNIIRKLLGHESLNTTQIYTFLSITDLKDVHKKCHPREKDKE